MNGIIDKMTTVCCMEAQALGIAVETAQRALEQAEGKRKTDKQTARAENIPDDFTVDADERRGPERQTLEHAVIGDCERKGVD